MSDKLWEAAMTACYGEKSPTLTQPERKKLGKLLNSIRELGVTPEEFTARAKQYPKVMPPGCKMTLAAIVNHWGRLAPPKYSPRPTSSYTPPPSIPLSDRLKGLETAKANLPAHFSRRIKSV